MSTSLAEQLQRLAVPQTAALKRDKKRASLLFDPREAAGLKRETVYQIGLEGLEELIAKNTVFEQFENSIFHITSKDFERSVQNNEANVKLNEAISKFLILLSPYFLLNCSHKALEWLINRYAINEYNRDELLMLILPYHESNVFVRMLQLLQFKDSKDSFYFLKALQKPGVHLPKHSLLQHAASNSGFLKFVTKYITLLLKYHEKPNVLTVAFNFYCSVFAGAIEYSEKVTEDQVSQMLPLILKGLSSDIPDFCASSYVVTARLVAKTSFSEKLLDKFVEKLSEANVSGLNSEMCLVLTVLYQSQEQYNNVPPTAVANLSEKEWVPKTLQYLNNSGSYILPLLEKLVKRCSEEGANNDLTLARDFVKNCLLEIKLQDSDVPSILHSILDSVKPKEQYPEPVLTWLMELIQMLEKQYPNAFDQEIIKILSGVKGGRILKRKNLLSNILSSTMACKGKFEILEKMYHPNPKMRSEAITYLKKNYNSLRDTHREIIKQSLLDRLNDDDINIVQETFSVVLKISIFEEVELKGILINLTRKLYRNKTGRKKIMQFVIKLLVMINDAEDWALFLAIFPFLLPETTNDLSVAKELIDCPCISNNILLKQILQKLHEIEKPEDFISKILEGLQSNESWDNVRKILQILQEVPKDERNTFHKYIASLILTNILRDNSPVDVLCLVLDILVTYYETCGVKSLSEKSDILSNISEAIIEKFPVQGYLECLENLIHKTNKQELDLASTDFSEDAPKEKYFVLLANILFNSQSKKTATVFLDYFCTDWVSKLNFLLNLCISESKYFDSNFKKCALKCLVKLLKDTENEELKQLIYIDKPATAHLLILLADPSDIVRKLTFEIIELLVNVSTRKSNSYFYLLEDLKKHKEEILTDHEQISLIMFNILDLSNTRGKKHNSDLNSIRNHLIKLVSDEKLLMYLKSGILNLLSYINTFDILEQLSNVAIGILQEKQEVIDGFKALVVKQIIGRIESKIANKISLTSNTWKLIECGITDFKSVVMKNEKNCPAALVMYQLGREFFEELKDDVEKQLLDIVVEVSCTAENPQVLPAANRIFKHIDLDANLILEQLTKMRDVQTTKTSPTKIKRRISVLPTVDILDTLEWKKGVSVLEFIQDKKKIRNTSVLLPVLFDVLKKCLDFDEQTAVEYVKQLVLSAILQCSLKMNEEVVPENVFNMELVVQCIRASQNPQTNHHALLLLANSAQLLPSQVLHHMMAIFTFMGSSVLRHDDGYSFQIITKIIDTIIPILVKDNHISTIAKVLRVFIDAMLDVPEYRRMPLYTQLLTKINVEEYLYLFLLLVFESQVLHSNQEKQKGENNSKRLDIASDLCRAFTPDIVLSNCIKLIKYINELPDEKEDRMETDDDSDTFNIITHSPKDFRHYKYLILKFTANLLTSEEFVKQIAALTGEEELNFENLYKEMIVNILQYIQRISKVAEKAVNTPQAQYWKVILHHSYDTLDSLNALVTPQMFLLVTKGLMVHTLSTVRRRILELLNTKLQYNAQFFAECQKTEIYTLIPPIVNIIEGINNEVDSEQEIIIQTALLSLKLLVKSLASEDPEKFVQILDFMTNVIKSGKAQNNILASVILCLAELCMNLKAHAIAGLAEFMPALIKILKQHKHEEVPSVLMRSVITTIEKIFISMPLFLSPYLEKLLVQLSILNEKWSYASGNQKLQPFMNKLASIKQKIGTIIPPRVLIPAIEECYNKLIEKKRFSAINALMDILAECLSNLKGREINSNLQELTNFFLNALKFRTDGGCSLEEANVVEGHIVQALTALILKLSEGSFRPLYYKIYDWAARNEMKSERIVTFYNLSSEIAESLKGLFVLFAGHFLNNAANVLDLCNTTKNEELYFNEESKNLLLLDYILKTLNSVFLYGNRNLITRDRFDILMQPLVDQLENTLGGEDNLLKRNEELLTPCLVHFALATADDALWKQMNYQILLKMRHNLPKVRLVALHCLTEIVKKLGEDFLSLLPETIPFLAELLEDEEENVEKACQKAVQEMEKVLGEPLQKYF